MDLPGSLVGRRAELVYEVTEADSAVSLGSGDVPVLATPRVLAWLEAATVAAVDGALPPGSTSVGTRVVLDHVAPTAVGDTVLVTAEVRETSGSTVTFGCVAADATGSVLARATVERAVVDRARFLRRLGDG